MDDQNRKRNIIIINAVGLVFVAASILMVATGNAGWLSWLMLGVAAVCIIIGRRLRP